MDQQPPPFEPSAAAASALPVLRAVAETLDSLGIGTCVFDEADRALVWNRTFLKLFPEHAAHIHVGEPYQANLRRFYQNRLAAGELAAMERYVADGLARHRNQQRPFAFEHLGVRLWAASLPLPKVGRIRIWQVRTPIAGPQGAQILSALGTTPIQDDALFEHVADGVMVTGTDDRIDWVNQSFVLMYDLPDREAARGQQFEWAYRAAWQGQITDGGVLFEAGLATLADSMGFVGAPFELPLPRDRWSRVIAQRSPDGKGYFAHVDISALKHQQRLLQAAERRARESEAILKEKSTLLEATLQRMEQGVLMVSAERVVEVCNRRARELLDLPQELMERRPTVDEVFAYQEASGEFAHTPPQTLSLVRAVDGLHVPHGYDRKRPNGRVIEVRSVPVEGGGMLRTYTDITERRLAEERIRHVASHDGLTSLVNREAFLESLASTAQTARSLGVGFAVHFIDIDRFKPINDNFGHAVGDKVLALLADRMRRIARDGDLVARMGGDEFAVLQYPVEQRDRALGLAYRLLEGISQAMEIESHSLQVGASIGIALYPEAGGDADTLLRNADAAMYAAKAAGRDCVQVYDSGTELDPDPD